jgi:hypothetical protein
VTTMAAGQKLERVIRVHGIEHPVILTVSNEGISFRVKGTQKAVTQSWTQVILACNTPMNVPCFLADQPLALLHHLAGKQARKAEKNG